MNYRKRFYTTARIEYGDKLENYWLTQTEGMQILKEIIPNNIIADYPSGGSFHPTTEEVSTFMGKPSISRNSIYFDEVKKAREDKNWGIVNKFLLGANIDGTISEKYIDKYVGFVLRFQENRWNSVVKKNGNWYKIDSLYSPKIELLSESQVYNFLQNHEVHISLKENQPK